MTIQSVILNFKVRSYVPNITGALNFYVSGVISGFRYGLTESQQNDMFNSHFFGI
jgi:hypothetical protein